MTKREICKRLIDLRDNMIHGQDSANSMGELSCVLSATGKLIRDLILDLAAPEEHFADAGKMMEKRREEETPPLFTYNDEGQKHPCPQCGQLCVRDMVTGNWWCRTHGSFKSTREEENHFADLGKKGATLPDGTPINLCGGHANEQA